MNQEVLVLFMLCFLVGGISSLTYMLQKQRLYLHRLDIKLDALLKHQGVELPSLSPEVQALALGQRKIAAIKLHREQNPDIGLAEAKEEVEAFTAKKH